MSSKNLASKEVLTRQEIEQLIQERWSGEHLFLFVLLIAQFLGFGICLTQHSLKIQQLQLELSQKEKQ